MSNANVFIIENGVLTKYVGPGGDVVIPEGVTTITENALWVVGKAIHGIVIPESVVTLENHALYGWELARRIHIPGTLCKSLGLKGIMKAFGTEDVVIFIWNLLEGTADYSEEFRDMLISNMLTKRFRQNNMSAFMSYRSDLLNAYISYWKKISLEEIDSYIDHAQKMKDPNAEVIALLMEYKNKHYPPKSVESIEKVKQDMDLGIKERSVAEWRKIFKCTIQDGCVTITEYRGTDADVIIPEKIGKNTVTAIGYGAFQNRDDIVSVSIPDSVSEIGHYAFSDCKELKEIRIPNGLTTLGEAVFGGCINLKTISIQKDHPAFAVCDGMVFDRTMKTLYFASGGITGKVSVPRTVTHIINSAFFMCNAIESICLPEGITRIGHSAFAWCESLCDLVLPKELTEVGDAMLRNCKKLTKLVVPDGVTSIPAQFVAFCDSLSSVILPDGLKSIEAEAFRGCESLHEIRIPASVKKIGFNWNSISDIVIHGKQGSGAEKYAKKYDVPFVVE